MRIPATDRTFLVAWAGFVIWILVAFCCENWVRLHALPRRLFLFLPLLITVIAWPLRNRSATIRPIMTAWFNTLWSYCLMVSLSAVLLLIVCSAVGYLPYSDRPGPGWGNIEPHFPVFEEVRYFSSWALMLLPISYFMGNVLFTFMAWIGWLKLPMWLARTLGGIFCSWLSMFAVAAAGWYIAISVSVTNSVGVCALLYGIFILPRISPRREMPLSKAARTAGAVLAFVWLSAYLAYPFLRH